MLAFLKVLIKIDSQTNAKKAKNHVITEMWSFPELLEKYRRAYVLKQNTIFFFMNNKREEKRFFSKCHNNILTGV